jgi:hypothetical protein
MKSTPADIRYYGIRHHGPGSASSLIAALEIQKPDIILIEGPSDAQAALQWIADPQLKPPVAMVIYEIDQPHNAIFYPIAYFSPEWQAMQFAVRNNIPFHFIDLPFQKTLSLKRSTAEEFESTETYADPFQLIASHQGWEDGESWWDANFETFEGPEIFPVVSQLMAAFRENEPASGPQPSMNAIREAYMAKSIQKLSSKYSNAAVVCGAWHLPALENPVKPSEIIKSIINDTDKIKTKTVWIPWTYKQLSFSSGYRSGVQAPVWYEMLFKNRKEAVLEWMAYVSQAARQKGFEIPPASSIDAAILARTLASMRGYPVPSYLDLKDAVQAVYGLSHHDAFNDLLSDIPYGNVFGEVPDSADQTPLQKDIFSHMKKLRLQSIMQEGIAQHKILDLRKEANRQTSIFLYRLWLLDIPFGQVQESSVKHTGTFREEWLLHWKQEFHLKILEAGIWGNTLVDAILNKIQMSHESLSLEALVKLLDRCLYADLPGIPDKILQLISDKSNLCRDIFILMRSVIALRNVLDRGSARNLDPLIVRTLIENMSIEVCASYTHQSRMLPLADAEQFLPDIPKFHMVLKSLENEAIQLAWKNALNELTQQTEHVHQLHGISFRIYLDYCGSDPEIQKRIIRLIFSASDDPIGQAAWIQGFIYDNYLLLLFDPALLELLNNWLTSMDQDAFDSAMPILRKVFADTPSGFKEKLMAILQARDKELQDPLPITSETRRSFLKLLN